MFCVKNVNKEERMLRVLMGMLKLAVAFMYWGTAPVTLVAGVGSATIAMTRLFGFFPMRAMVGRNLDKKQ